MGGMCEGRQGDKAKGRQGEQGKGLKRLRRLTGLMGELRWGDKARGDKAIGRQGDSETRRRD